MKTLTEQIRRVVEHTPDNLACTKQRVFCMAIVDNMMVVGENRVTNKQDVCPRVAKGYGTGEGYHHCKAICGQEHHAEIDLIDLADGDLKGADVYLYGHNYMCKPCVEALHKANCGSLWILTHLEEM